MRSKIKKEDLTPTLDTIRLEPIGKLLGMNIYIDTGKEREAEKKLKLATALLHTAFSVFPKKENK